MTAHETSAFMWLNQLAQFTTISEYQSQPVPTVKSTTWYITMCCTTTANLKVSPPAKSHINPCPSLKCDHWDISFLCGLILAVYFVSFLKFVSNWCSTWNWNSFSKKKNASLSYVGPWANWFVFCLKTPWFSHLKTCYQCSMLMHHTKTRRKLFGSCVFQDAKVDILSLSENMVSLA